MHNILKILTPCHILSHIQNLGPGPAPSRSEHQMASPSTNSCNSIEIRPVGGSITEKHHLQPSSLGASLCLEDCLCTDTEARDDSCMDVGGKQPLLHLHLNMDIVHQQLDDDTTESYIYIYMDLGCLIKVSTNIYQLYSQKYWHAAKAALIWPKPVRPTHTHTHIHTHTPPCMPAKKCLWLSGWCRFS